MAIGGKKKLALDQSLIRNCLFLQAHIFYGQVFNLPI